MSCLTSGSFAASRDSVATGVPRITLGWGDSKGPAKLPMDEFYDPEDAVRQVLGSGAAVKGVKVFDDMGPVTNSEVRKKLKAMGYDPDDFKAIQYEVQTGGGTRIVTVFEANSGSGSVIVGPHVSSAD